MRRKLLFLGVLSGVIVTIASAQISLDASDFQSMVGEQLTVTTYSITTTSTTYDFITQGDLSADIIVDETGMVIAAGYEVLQSDAPSSSEGDEELPESILLLQNYPNPFNPSTRIPLRLLQPKHVTLRVYDVLGRPVDTLVDGVLPAGSHTVFWHVGTLSNGLYVYRLSAGEVVLTRKMVLLR